MLIQPVLLALLDVGGDAIADAEAALDLIDPSAREHAEILKIWHSEHPLGPFFTYYFTSTSLSEFDHLVEPLNVTFSLIDELARSYAIDNYPTRSGHLDESMILILTGSLLLVHSVSLPAALAYRKHFSSV